VAYVHFPKKTLILSSLLPDHTHVVDALLFALAKAYNKLKNIESPFDFVNSYLQFVYCKRKIQPTIQLLTHL